MTACKLLNVRYRWFFPLVEDKEGLCYTFNNYKDMIVRKPDNEVPKIVTHLYFSFEQKVVFYPNARNHFYLQIHERQML
jgi:hypothetical protein